MRRHPVSIVILAWNAWEETQACLESLRPTLQLDDQVIVVDNGSTDATPARLKLFSWVEVLTNPENLGFAGGCNQGASAAEHELVVFLNNDTVLQGHWIDALVAPFDDPGVGATGPRSNFVSGPQVAEGATYANGDRAGMRRFARQWAEDHRGEVSTTERLVGFCLAVRAQAFEAVGGFDEGYRIGGFEDDDLCRRLGDAGWSLVVAHESFVHHAGHRTFDANQVDWLAQQDVNRGRFEEKFGDRSARDFPLASACLIVRDEEENLADCLGSIDGLVDELVVYDTGSVDGTVALARKLGATVIEGTWDDDFSRARNAALAECHGEWIVWLDADETLVCDDLVGLRNQLARTGPEVEGFSVAIDNLVGSGMEPMFVHSACRMFRRASCEWTGRLHEQVAGRQGHRPVATTMMERARIRHTGYLTATMTHRGKIERNLRVAAEEVERSESWDRGFSLTSLGRSYMTAGRAEEAADACRRGAAETKNPVTRRLALRTLVEALVALGRTDEATVALDELRAASDRQVLVDLLDATICRQRGEHQRAIDLLEQMGASETDDDGFEYEASMFARLRSDSMAALGRFKDAAAVLVEVLADKSILDTHLGTLVDYLDRAGLPLDALADALPTEQLPLLLAQLLQLEAEPADRVLESCFERRPADALPILATAASLAQRLGVERALVWSARLRERDLAPACPLVVIAGDGRHTPVERARAAAAGYRLFGDPRLSAAFPVCMAAGSAEDRQAILQEVAALCPQLLGEPSQAPPVSIVIPCWNKSEYTLRCLQSIQAHTPAGSYEVVLVDNGSTDATATLDAAPDDPLFRVLRNTTNLGFARACNQGAAAARHEVLVFLNNDVEVLPGWLPPLQDALLEAPEVAAVGARLLFPGGTIQHSGVALGYSNDGLFDGFHLHYRQPGTFPPALVARPLRAVTGAAMAVRRTAFDQVGGFDEEYWNGNEDVDLCLAMGERGWRIVYQPASCAIHHESVSGPERFSGLEANRKRFTLRWSATVVADTAPVTSGVNVLGSFTASTEAGRATRGLVDGLEAAGIPVVTTTLTPETDLAAGGTPETDLAADGDDWFRHRLGPVQATTVAYLPDTDSGELTNEPGWRDATHRIAVWPHPGRTPSAWQASVMESADQRVTTGGAGTSVERCIAAVRAHLDSIDSSRGTGGQAGPGGSAGIPATPRALIPPNPVCLEIGGGTHPRAGWTNLDPVHGEGKLCRRIQDGIPLGDSSVDLVRASHVLEHIPTEDRIGCMNEVHRVLKPGGIFEVIVPLFPSWQAMADPTHVSYWVEQSFWYFTGQWAPQADYGMLRWRWASTDEVGALWHHDDPGPAVRGLAPAPWLVLDGWEGHAHLVKPEPA